MLALGGQLPSYASAASANQISNGGFESGAGGWGAGRGTRLQLVAGGHASAHAHKVSQTAKSGKVLLTRSPRAGLALFTDSFNRPDGLITNEYAYWHPNATNRVTSPGWVQTSGSVFARGGTAWSGVPDTRPPNATSSNGTNSAVFRLHTKRSDFGSVAVSMGLRNNGLSTTASTPAEAWDGVHMFLRYQSAYTLYYASINRRDGTVVIKKKVPGGPSNGGTYYQLGSSAAHAVPYGVWQQIKATVRNNPDGSVTIRLFANNALLAEAVDNGSVGGPPITHAGATGVRGDNANFQIKDFVVSQL
ncbi:MAG: hypothetical protein NVSMB32_10870 [Actinomycetota bacterium]